MSMVTVSFYFPNLLRPIHRYHQQPILPTPFLPHIFSAHVYMGSNLWVLVSLSEYKRPSMGPLCR